MNVAALTFNISERQTFDDLTYWITDIKENWDHDFTYMLLGNMCDLKDKREVTSYEAQEFANEHKMQYYEVSAKTGENLESSFIQMIENIYKCNIQSEMNQVRHVVENQLERINSRPSKLRKLMKYIIA